VAAVKAQTAAIEADTQDLQAQVGVDGAGLTNIPTVATVTTVTNLTNAPTSGDFTATMKTSLNAATPAATVSDKTGFSLTAAYDPAKTAAQASNLATAQADLDILTGADGATLATLQGNYAPAKAGAQMDLVNAPNATAVTAIQDGLSKPGTAQTITAPADMALNSTVAKDATVFKAADYTAPDNTGIGNIKTVTDKIDTALALDGAVYQYTANALELAPTGGTAPTVVQIRQEMDANSTKLTDILADTGTTIPAQISGLNNLSAAQVTAAVPTASQNAAAVIAAAETTPVEANVKQFNDVSLVGNGTDPKFGVA
jgi:ferritin-like protein